MTEYAVMQVCLNGHKIIEDYFAEVKNRKNYCEICGSRTITRCVTCDAPILGHVDLRNEYNLFGRPVPLNCHKCGNPHPWKYKEIPENYLILEPFKILEFVCTRFHVFVKNLTRPYMERENLKIEDEFDFQHLLFAQLKVFFNDMKREEPTPVYAGSSSRMFIEYNEKKYIFEARMVDKDLEAKKIKSTIGNIIKNNLNNESMQDLFCFIYDPECKIGNSNKTEEKYNREDPDCKIKVLIYPKNIKEVKKGE
jgi:hypothetical protein